MFSLERLNARGFSGFFFWFFFSVAEAHLCTATIMPIPAASPVYFDGGMGKKKKKEVKKEKKEKRKKKKGGSTAFPPRSTMVSGVSLRHGVRLNGRGDNGV